MHHSCTINNDAELSLQMMTVNSQLNMSNIHSDCARMVFGQEIESSNVTSQIFAHLRIKLMSDP